MIAERPITVPASLWHAMVEHLCSHSAEIKAIENRLSDPRYDHAIIQSELSWSMAVTMWEQAMGAPIEGEVGRRVFSKDPATDRYSCRLKDEPEHASLLIEFEIPMAPRPKQSFKKGQRGGYTRKEIRQNAEALCAYMLPHRPAVPLEGPVEIDIEVHWEWRKSEPLRNRTRPRRRDTVPDHDNLSKQVCDAMQKTGFFKKGDQQISDSHCRKRWADEDKTIIHVWEVAA